MTQKFLHCRKEYNNTFQVVMYKVFYKHRLTAEAS